MNMPYTAEHRHLPFRPSGLGWVLGALLCVGGSFFCDAETSLSGIDIQMTGERWATGGDSDITFTFRMAGTNDTSLIRYQHKLDGRHPDWQEPSDVMRLVAMFLGEKNKLLAIKEATFKNTSPGWTGLVETSPMLPGHMEVDVPKEAKSVLVTLTSAGPATALGIIALGDLRVTAFGTNHAERLLYQLAFSTNKTTGRIVEPLNASESGINRTLAKVVQASYAPSEYALAILDNDKTSHAEWQTHWIPLSPQRDHHLHIEWLLSHSIGLANQTTYTYTKLTPGSYCFRVKPVSALGVPFGKEATYTFDILLPFWETRWFQGLVLLVILGGVFGATRYYYKQRSRRIIERLEQQQAVERERMRIARDIHDDLGSTLAQISMLSQPPPTEATLEEARQILGQINSATVDMSVTMDEIVWTLNPTKDRLDHLLNYFDNFAQEFLRFSKITVRFECPTTLPLRELNSTCRHNLFLAYKEALANAVKYAGCKEIRVRYESLPDGFAISVCDDGCGFDLSKTSDLGNGLANMRQRLADIGGQCHIESSPGHGTRITFTIKD